MMTSASDATLEATRERRLLSLLIAICGLVMLTGFTMTRASGRGSAPAGIVLGDVSHAQIVEIRDVSGQTVLSGEFRSRVDQLGNTEKDAALIDRRGRAVIGEVELELPAQQAREHRRPELEVDIMGLPPLAAFTVVIDDRAVGGFTTDDRGSVDLELQEGEIAPVPPKM
jgi:hypothetical protein